MKNVAIAISLFTLLPVFSLAATGVANLEENMTRIVINSVPPSQPQTKIPDGVVLKIIKNLLPDWDWKFNDEHTKIKTTWQGPSLNFNWTSNGFFVQRTRIDSRIRINCVKRLDGFYFIVYNSLQWKKDKEYVADKNGTLVNNRQILTNYRNRNLNSLNKIALFNEMNKNMISYILAAYGIYAIDYVNEGEVFSLYGDALDKNIDIKFIKQDDKTIYGTLFVSKNNDTNESSEIYAFKYLDQTTPNKQRVKLMTKRVVQDDLNDQFPDTKKNTFGSKSKESRSKVSGISLLTLSVHSTSNVISQYEQFLAEGVIHTTYTLSNGKLYKNQKELF